MDRWALWWHANYATRSRPNAPLCFASHDWIVSRRHDPSRKSALTTMAASSILQQEEDVSLWWTDNIARLKTFPWVYKQTFGFPSASRGSRQSSSNCSRNPRDQSPAQGRKNVSVPVGSGLPRRARFIRGGQPGPEWFRRTGRWARRHEIEDQTSDRGRWDGRRAAGSADG